MQDSSFKQQEARNEKNENKGIKEMPEETETEVKMILGKEENGEKWSGKGLVC